MDSEANEGSPADLLVKRDAEGGGRLPPGLAIDLDRQRLLGRDDKAAALRQPDGTRQTHLQLAQVPAAIDCHHLDSHSTTAQGACLVNSERCRE